MAVSTGYATALALLERRFRLKPDHEWLEVAVGVGLTLVPIAVEAHAIEQEHRDNQADPVSWKTYEGAIWRSFLASGVPIICWQIGEAIVRKLELMNYVTFARTTQSKPTGQIVYKDGKWRAGGFSADDSGYITHPSQN
jgi:hypothetical protein